MIFSQSRRFLATRSVRVVAIVIAVLAVLGAGTMVAQADNESDHAHVIYRGPVRYAHPCNGPNSSFTSMDSSDTQVGCQVSSNGGREVMRSDCSRTRNDQGTWTYTPTGQDAQYDPSGFTYNGTFREHNTIRDGIYSGEETFVDRGVGTVHQRYTARVTQDPTTCAVTNTYDWYVQTKGTGQLWFLTGTAGTRPARGAE